MTISNDAIELPNQFELSGHDISISVTLASVTGGPLVSYQDRGVANNFTGDAVTVEDTALGTLVTVTTAKTVDAGFTTVSVLLPSMNLISSNHHVDTIAIVGLHRTPITGIGHGQTTTFHTVSVHGSARQIQSLT